MRLSIAIKSLTVLLVTLSFVFFFASCGDDDEPVVTKDEGLYINEIHAAGPDWIELYNSSDAAKTIGGYRIYDDATKKYTIPANTSVPSKGFLVLICDDTGTGLNTNFKLSSSGETVYLENTDGTLIDKVTFPAMGEGQSYGRYPDGSDALLMSGSTTQGASNGGSQAPAIVDVTRVPKVPALDQDVTVQAEFVSTEGITSVKLFYRLNAGAFLEVTMTKSGNFFNGVIPAFNAVGKVDYYVQATSGGGTTAHPAEAPGKTHDYLLNTDPLPDLRINEFLASNTSCCPDNDSGTDEFDDWIEIYNAGNTAVDVGGMYLSDDKTSPFNSKLPTDNPSLTTIASHGFLIVWADGTKTQGPLHLDFSLSGDGEDVAIFYKDGRLIDSYTYPAQTENVSTGRSVNGAGTWVTFATPTPAASNQ